MQFLVMDELGPAAERHRAALAERPFAPVAVGRPHIAVDVESALWADWFVPEPCTRYGLHSARSPGSRIRSTASDVDRPTASSRIAHRRPKDFASSPCRGRPEHGCAG